MVFATRPDFWFGVAPNRDPGDNVPVPNWVNFVNTMRAVDKMGRGKQYELGLPQSVASLFTFRDVDEYLNPANTSSPYFPNVLPYREVCWLGQWPNGTAGNLLNLNTWRNPVDPSLDSYTAGTTPPWVTAVGPLTSAPVVGTTNPHSAPNCLTYTQSSTAASQGAQWPVACIPGRQYTTSVYLRQTGAAAQFLGIGGLTAGLDAFGRTSASTWGNADVGGAWTNSGGAAGDYNVTNPYGTHTHTATNTPHTSLIAGASNFADFTPATYVAVPVTATGAPIRAGVLARATTAAGGTWYAAVLDFNTDQSTTLSIIRNSGGAETTLASVGLGNYTPGVFWGIRLDLAGTNISARAWPETSVELGTWLLTTTDTSNANVSNATGLYSRVTTGNTNTLPLAVSFRAFGCAATKLSSSTSTTGAYVRLSLTYNATQPAHTVVVKSLTGVAANVVNLDDFQHEQAASASAFTTTGPVIYPITRLYAEHEPRVWDSTGFEGMAQLPCVDALALLATRDIQDELSTAILASHPQFYWRLDDGSGATRYLDVSGNHGPPLVPHQSKYGPGNQLTSTGIPIPGDITAQGVGISPSNPGITRQPATGLAAGQYAGQIPLNLPGNLPGAWGMTFLAWVQCNQTTPSGGQNLAIVYTLTSGDGSTANNPLGVNISSASGLFIFYQGGQSSTQEITAAGGPPVMDGLPHMVAMVVTQTAGGNTVITGYVDGQVACTTSGSLNPLPGPAHTIDIGGIIDPLEATSILNGAVAQAALYDRALTATEITAIWTAGGTGYAGETTGARLLRHLAAGGYVGPTRVSAGTSTMQPPSFAGTTDLFSDAQVITTTELGTLWVAPDGALAFEGRTDRFLRLTPAWTFGEHVGSGETPYLPGITFDNDPTYVYSDVRVTRAGGATARGGDAVSIAAAARRYAARAFQAPTQVDTQTDDLAQGLADWIFYTHDQAFQRITGMVIDPASNPTLWAVALGIEIGDRVTVARRPLAANAGAGISMVGDFFIEYIEHSGIDLDTGTWTTRVQVSPAQPSSTFQPWILGDATFGVLGTTTLLGV